MGEKCSLIFSRFCCYSFALDAQLACFPFIYLVFRGKARSHSKLAMLEFTSSPSLSDTSRASSSSHHVGKIWANRDSSLIDSRALTLHTQYRRIQPSCLPIQFYHHHIVVVVVVLPFPQTLLTADSYEWNVRTNFPSSAQPKIHTIFICSV